MANETEATHKLEDVEVFKVDVVGKPATGDTFLVVRDEESGGAKPVQKRRGFRKEAVEALKVERKKTETKPVAELETESVERAVPPADVPREKKRQVQKARASQYGIEALENKGENLSYPANAPTTESLYGDPVNLKYPMGYADNKLSATRANNARARFKQAYQIYSQTSSRRVIHNRIVAAQIKAGASPSYNPDDPLDKLLSGELKQKLQSAVSRNEIQTEEKTMKELEAVTSRLDKAIERMEKVFSGVLGQTKEEAPTTDEAKKEDPEKIEGQPEAKQEVTTKTPESTHAASDKPVAIVSQPEPVQTAPEPVAALKDYEQSLANEAAVVERMGKALEDGLSQVKKSVSDVTGRLDKVERSIRSGGNAQETEEIERSDNTGIDWSNLLGPIVQR